MKLVNFFRLLKRKVNKYDYCLPNPFSQPHPVTVIWVENQTEEKVRNNNFYRH